MNEGEGYLINARKNGVCWIQFYSQQLDHDDLFKAVNYCGFYPVGFQLDETIISSSNKPLLDETPIAGVAGDIWVVKGSIREDRDGGIEKP